MLSGSGLPRPAANSTTGGVGDSDSSTTTSSARRRISERDAALRRKFGDSSSSSSSSPGASTTGTTLQRRGSMSSPASARRMSTHGKVSGASTATASPLNRRRGANSSSLLAVGSHDAVDAQAALELPRVQVQPGTVAAMKPPMPVSVGASTAVFEVARIMAARKVDAVLVTDTDTGLELRGIVTDKDLAFRCVAAGLEPRTPISTIMTPSPTHVPSTASVDDAVNLMLGGHFRHLPVVDGGRIVGLLDVTKVLMHVRAKIENSWGKASVLQDAFQAMKQWENFSATPEVQAWFQDWGTKMQEPDLTQVLDYSHPLPIVTLKTSVRDAARLMKDMRQTAVLVYDQHQQELHGIFTTKDICLRVLAPNDLEPRSTSVVRVMTPHPDCGLETMTIHAALKKMHDGHYLHLPIKSATSDRVVGLVDVLTLTYHTMEQLLMQKETKASDITVSAPSNVIVDDDGHADAATPAPKTVTTAPAEDITPGPMWSRFFEHAPITEDVEARIHAANARVADTTFSAPSSIGGGCGSQSATTVVPGLVNGSGYVFKFRDPVTATLHRFTSRVVAGTAGESPLGELLAAVVAKCGCVLALEEEYDTLNATKPLFTGSSAASMNGDIASSCDDEASAFRSMAIVRQYTKNQHVRAVLKDDAAVHDEENAEEDVNAAPVYHYFRISYRDDEGDLVFLHSDADLLDAVGVARMMGWGRLVLHVDVAVDDITTGQRVPLKAHAVHSPEMTTAHDEDEELLADESVMSAVPDMSAVPAASKKSFVDMNNAMIIGAVGAAVGVLAIGVMVAKQLRGSNK